MGELSERQQEILSIFSKYGFKLFSQNLNSSTFISTGQNYSVYLNIMNDMFSIKCVDESFTNYIFRYQHYENLAEIESLFIKNHVLSEEILEPLDLAVYS